MGPLSKKPPWLPVVWAAGSKVEVGARWAGRVIQVGGEVGQTQVGGVESGLNLDTGESNWSPRSKGGSNDRSETRPIFSLSLCKNREGRAERAWEELGRAWEEVVPPVLGVRRLLDITVGVLSRPLDLGAQSSQERRAWGTRLPSPL